jgi:hypothetical protein
MRRIRLRRPSPALVIACLALAVALGGTSYATVLQVPRASVGTPQLKNAAVTSPKVRNNAITSRKVANGTLVRADFRSGTLLVGPPGPAGPAGPPGVSAVERVEASSPVSSTAVKTLFIACPTGKRLLGGGTRLNGAIGDDVALQSSYPDNDNIYRARAAEVNPIPGTWGLTVFAICGVTT